MGKILSDPLECGMAQLSIPRQSSIFHLDEQLRLEPGRLRLSDLAGQRLRAPFQFVRARPQLLFESRIEPALYFSGVAQLAILPGTSHSAVYMQTDALAQLITAFLDAPMPEAA